MSRPNIFTAAFEYDPGDPPGYLGGIARIGRAAGGSDLAVKLFELPAGEKLCPYHYEYEEEWLILLGGELDLRTPLGIERLATGDVVRFPPGPDGAHQVSTPAEATSPARLIMFSSSREPAVAVYPDSDKVGVWTPGGAANGMFSRAKGDLPYYEGEV